MGASGLQCLYRSDCCVFFVSSIVDIIISPHAQCVEKFNKDHVSDHLSSCIEYIQL